MRLLNEWMMDEPLNDNKVKEFCAGIPTPLFFCQPVFVHDFQFRQKFEFTVDNSGKSHHINAMPTLTQKRPTVVEDYDVAADAKKRISLRSAKTKYFHVKALSNGCFYLEPRVLVPPQAISARSLKMLDKSVANLKKGLASAPIDPSVFAEA
jgi:hypothetical protein